MSKRLEEVHRDIITFIVSNMSAIITEISNSSEQYCHFCEDGNFDIMNIYETADHLCEVRAKGIILDPIVSQMSDGAWQDVNPISCTFVFYIDIDENGEYKYNIPFNEDGSFDFEEDIVEEP